MEGQMTIFDFIPEQEPEKPICRMASECDNYPTACGGTIYPCRFNGAFKYENNQRVLQKPEHDITYDRNEKEHEAPSWMKYERCENCQRWARYVKDEQPPNGWGIYGWCNEHNQKTTLVSYCMEFLRR